MAKFNLKFWQKKEEKEKEPLPENATTFQKLWHNKQTNAAMRLGIWFVFIIFVIVFLQIAGRMIPKSIPDKKEKEKETVKYEDMFSILQDSNYEFTYKVKVSDQIISYQGTRKDNLVSGYKETNEELLKYLIEDNKIYKVLGDKKEEINYLYQDLDKDLVDLNYIQLLLFGKEYTQKDNDETKIYLYDKLEIPNKNIEKIEITTNEENIEKIYIKTTTIEYELIYSNIVLKQEETEKEN